MLWEIVLNKWASVSLNPDKIKTDLCLAKSPGHATQNKLVVVLGQQRLEEGGKCPLGDKEVSQTATEVGLLLKQ